MIEISLNSFGALKALFISSTNGLGDTKQAHLKAVSVSSLPALDRELV